MGCLRCGRCCGIVGVALSDDEPADVRRFNELHGFAYQDGGKLAAIMARCSAFAVDADGRGVCAIYETRPAICQRYLCDAARDADG